VKKALPNVKKSPKNRNVDLPLKNSKTAVFENMFTAENIFSEKSHFLN
jgi:hypothetical protein